MSVKLIISEDGSHTLLHLGLDEHYHSTYGAIQESRHVFINAGYCLCQQEKLNILEIGFGTGLNAFLTCIESRQSFKVISYTTLEPFPLSEDIWLKLNYPAIIGNNDALSFFKALHKADWNREISIHDNFTILKRAEKLEAVPLEKDHYNLIYFDAFSPANQPELWNLDIFRKIYAATATGGILVTYSAMGSVRRAMKDSGFRVERLSGPPGKREMLRATKH